MLAVLLFMDGKENSGCKMVTVDGGKVMENGANDASQVLLMKMCCKNEREKCPQRRLLCSLKICKDLENRS